MSIFTYYFQIIFLVMFQVILRCKCPLKVQQLKIEGEVPQRLPGEPMINPQILKANFARETKLIGSIVRANS